MQAANLNLVQASFILIKMGLGPSNAPRAPTFDVNYVSSLHMGLHTGVTFSNEEFSSLIKLLFGTLDSALGPSARTFLNIARFRNYNFFLTKIF